MKTAIPKLTKKPNVFALSAALNAGARNSLRSISGSASRCCLYANAAAEPQTDENRRQGHRPHAVLGDLLEAVDDRQHRGERKDGAYEVEPTRRRVSVLGQKPRSEHEQQPHHRQRRQEHRAPPETLQQQPADQRADSGSGGEARDPHADREGALGRVVEHVPDQGERRRRKRRPGDPEQRPSGDQHLGARRERREHRGEAERARADQEQAAATDPVTQGAHRDQQAGDQEPVDVDDPEQLSAARLEVLAERGEREVQHREVHGVDRARKGDHREPEPLAAPGLGGGHGRPLVIEIGVMQ